MAPSRSPGAAPAAPAQLTSGQATTTTGRQAGGGGGAGQADDATGLLVGRVVEADGRRPVAGVVVTLNGAARAPALSGRSGSASQPRRVVTGADGRYLFRDLPAGSYRLTASRQGYYPGQYGSAMINGAPRTATLAAGERRAGIDIRLWKLGVISGVVLDEAGEPAVGARVMLLRRVFQRGQELLAPTESDTTDDRGAYRLASVMPDTYVVFVPSVLNATPASTAALLEAPIAPADRQAIAQRLQQSGAQSGTSGFPYAGQLVHVVPGFGLMPPAPDESGLQVYPATFYPNARGVSEAQFVTVGAGQEIEGIDFRMPLVRTTVVSGTVLGPNGPVPHIAVRLIPAGGLAARSGASTGMEAATGVTDASGRFVLVGVPEGQYELRSGLTPRPPPPPPPPPPPRPGVSGAIPAAPVAATVVHSIDHAMPGDEALSGQLVLAVGATEVRDVSLVLVAGGTIRGRVEFEGSAPRPTPEELSRFTVGLIPLDPSVNDGSATTRVDARGTFVAASRQAGRYLATANGGSPWTVKSILIDGRDATESAFELAAPGIDNVVVTFTDSSTTLSGSVAIGAGGPPPDPDERLSVIVFPVDYEAWFANGMSSRRLRITEADAGGRFTVSGLSPGEYLIVATASGVPPFGFVPDDFAQLARAATRVTIRAGSKASITLSQVHRR